MNDLTKYSNLLEKNSSLSYDEAYQAFCLITELQSHKDQIKEFLLKINEKGINGILILGAVRALSEKMITILAPENAIDVCGTGGDQLHTLNISTAVSFVVAACGIPVAKHGNRAVSSSSGSADIFTELGIDVNQTPQKAKKSLFENNLAFLFAPIYHPVLKNLAEVRKEIKTKTIFNYLGPLLNPAKTKYQLVGCPDQEIASYIIKISKLLNKTNCVVVCGLDGMDEISISDNSAIFAMPKEVYSGNLFNPEDYGFKKVPIQQIQGKDPKYNAQKLLDLLQGKKSAYRDIVILNSAMALKVAEKTDDFHEAIEIAKEAIDNKSAYNLLKKLQQN